MLFLLLQLILLVKNALLDSSMYGHSSLIFIHTSNLLRYWSKLHSTADIYQELTENLWASIHQLISNSITTFKNNTNENNYNLNMTKDELEKKLRIHQKIINALKNPVDVKQKKQVKVRFQFTFE